ncbi:MAG: T9SS type A sorting domain-containing protein, partial [Bacteroidota bacterium]
GSTADEGVDISEIVDSAYMAPYEYSDTIYYEAFNDGIEEGTETMILEFWTECPCGNTGGNSVLDTINIYDAESIKGGIQDVQTNYCGEEPPETLDLVGEVNIDPAYYEWCTGEETNTITIEPSPGIETYNVTISDQCGNEVYDSATIRVSSMQLENIDVEQVSCYNACDGSMEIDVINDFQPFTYIYGNADYFYFEDSLTTTMDPLIQNLCPKDYYVKIVDSIGCYLTTEVTVPNETNIDHSPGIINSSTSYCEDPGEITLNAEASTDNATFTWWNGDNGSSTTVTPSQGENDYWVEISDGCGNIFEDHVIIAVSEIDLDINVEPDVNENCDGSISVYATGGIPPYTYYWDDPHDEFGQEQEDLCAGDYVVIVGDNNGCEYIDTITVDASDAIGDENLYPVEIYPNPAQTHAFVDLSGLTTNSSIIKIFTITGQEISSVLTTEDVYKTPELPAGSYMIKVFNEEMERLYLDKLIITE